MGVKSISDWLNIVCDKVKFIPDRKEIYQELNNHMEERLADYREKGVSYEDAIKEVLDAMGNPEQVGTELNKTHKPYLGWVWYASKWLVRIVLLLCIWVFLNGTNPLTAYCYLFPESKDFSVYDNNYKQAESETFSSTLYQPDCTASLYGYTLTIPRASLHTYNEASIENKDVTSATLFLTLRAVHRLPWTDFPMGIQFLTTAIDSEGNFYNCSYDAITPSIYGNPTKRGLFYYEFELYIPNIDTHATWIELHPGGNDDNNKVRLRIQLR